MCDNSLACTLWFRRLRVILVPILAVVHPGKSHLEGASEFLYFEEICICV